MSDDVVLPYRPRVAEHGMLRRHLIDGAEKFLLHDGVAEEVIELSEVQLTVLLACDGTRDLGGIMLAASHLGAYRRGSEIETMLFELHTRGLIADGIAATHPDPQPSSGRPVRVLSDFALRCDGHGSCCTTYSTIPFTVDDARRAELAVPEVARDAKLFLPLCGSAPSRVHAVTMCDGRCSFLADDGRCRVHAAAGVEAKPRGCQGFPACYIDDGIAVRVSAAVECACVLRSLEGECDGSPLAVAAVAADLKPGTPVAEVAATVALAPGKTASRDELTPWADAVTEALDGCDDAVAAFWSLAQAVAEHGLDPEPSARAVTACAPPDAAAIGFRLLALAGKTAGKRESSAAWRAQADRARRLSGWLDDAAQSLTDIATAGERLSGPGTLGSHEAFYLRSLCWGLQVVSHRLALVQSLRDRAIRALLARQCGLQVPTDCADDPSVAYPLTAVEAMMRGQGLDAYAVGLS